MRDSRTERVQARWMRPVGGAVGTAGSTLAVLWLAAWPAAAQETAGVPSPREQARQHYDAGATAFEAGDFAAALVALDESYRLFPSLRTLYSLGLCQHALGSFGPALRSLEQYLREAGADAPADLRSRAEALVAQLRAELGRIDVQVNVEGVDLLVDGEVVGRSPLHAPVDVGPGWHVVEARHEQWDGSAQRVNVTAGGTATVALALERRPEPTPPPTPEVAPPAAPTVGPPDGVSEQEWYGISDADYRQYVYSTGRHQPLANWLLERNRENPDLDLGIILAGSQGAAWLAAGTLVYLVHEKNWETNGDDLPWLSFFQWLLGGALTLGAVAMVIVDALDVDKIAVEHPERLIAPRATASMSAPTAASELEQRWAADAAPALPVDVSLGVTGLTLRF